MVHHRGRQHHRARRAAQHDRRWRARADHQDPPARLAPGSGEKLTNQAYTLSFASIGQDVAIWPLAKIVSPELISIGDSVIIDDFVFLMAGAKTTIGSFVHIASFASITGGGQLVVEDFAGISSG